MKKKVLLTSILTILLCICLISGSTFALFHSVVTADIKVTAGQIKLYANVDDASLALTSRGQVMSGNTFANGGWVTISGRSMEMFYVTPGDAAAFNIEVDNTATNVAAKYMVTANVTGALANELTITVKIGNGNPITMTSNGANFTTGWVDFSDIAGDIEVQVTFNEDATDAYQGKTANIVFNIEAIQANAAN